MTRMRFGVVFSEEDLSPAQIGCCTPTENLILHILSILFVGPES